MKEFDNGTNGFFSSDIASGPLKASSKTLAVTKPVLSYLSLSRLSLPGLVSGPLIGVAHPVILGPKFKTQEFSGPLIDEVRSVILGPKFKTREFSGDESGPLSGVLLPSILLGSHPRMQPQHSLTLPLSILDE